MTDPMTNQPAPSDTPLRLTIEGESWYLYEVEYHHDGKTWSFEIYSRSHGEAEEMVRSIRRTAIETNRVIARFPASNPVAGPWVKFLCWIKNLLHS